MSVSAALISGEDIIAIRHSTNSIDKSIRELRAYAGIARPDGIDAPSLSRVHAAGLLIEGVLSSIEQSVCVIAKCVKDKSGSEMPNWTINHEDMLSVLEATNRLMSRSQGLVYLGKLLKETSEPGTGEQIHQLLEALASELEEYLAIIVPLVVGRHAGPDGARQEGKGPE